MSEEELNKMAVHLLNCQLEIENRPTFECEESMSIGTSMEDDRSFEKKKEYGATENVTAMVKITCFILGECTSKMDATEWNGYQIVANRARAVCYTTRQQIFRIKTEAAVNKLVQTSQEQISGMEKLREDQQMLGKVVIVGRSIFVLSRFLCSWRITDAQKSVSTSYPRTPPGHRGYIAQSRR